MTNNALELSQEATTTDVGAALFSAITQLQAGNQARAALNFQAGQLRVNAGQAQASAQRQAADVDRQSQIIASSALAHAAASGGGASDPTVVNLIARNAQESAYRKAVALYGGDDEARSMLMQADAKQYEGKLAKSNATQNALATGYGVRSTLMKGMARDSSLYQRFGAGGPQATAGNN